MSYSLSKSIFISYAENDKATAIAIRETLTDLLGEEVWLKDFDLNGGDLVAEAISEAIAEAKWFILILSASSIKSKWVMAEANWATIRSIEDLGFKIIVLSLDNSVLPGHLEIALKSKMIIDLSKTTDKQNDFIKIAEYIYQHSSLGVSSEVYVDRGEDLDQFSILARRNRVVFITGWAGVGKTSFVSNSVSERLRKFPIKIPLSRGHSIDLLARQILYRCHVKQPISSSEIDESRLVLLAIEAVRERAQTHFLFFDNGEFGLGSSSEFLPFLESFLELFIRSDIQTHLVLATTRAPEITPSISKAADILPLYGLSDEYIREAVDLWLEKIPKHKEIMKAPELIQLIELVGGHPLAAKMLASSLKVKTPEQILSAKEKRKFELMFAEYILRSSDHSDLDEIDRLILQILATVKEPMLLQDMLAVRELNQYPLEAIHASRTKLASLFLIEQTYEMMSLHNFLATYYQDQLTRIDKRRDVIAYDFGLYAFKKVKEMNERLNRLTDGNQSLDSDHYLETSNSIFRYAIPAGRLLRSVGKDQLADELPIKVKGTLRELVFFFYQEAKDYRKARDYAENWLRIVPNDNEIKLYLVRCYRNLRSPESLAKGEKLLKELGYINASPQFTARIYRERALIADFQGHTEAAKYLFNEGIQADRRTPYPENYVGLAQILVRQSEESSHNDKRRENLAKEAVRLLDTARSLLPTFDRFHLGLYIEALIESGDVDKALPLLDEALDRNPNNERLNYRMAEIMRKREQFDMAERFARIALKNGAPKAPLSLANILHSQSISLDKSDRVAVMKKLEEALQVIQRFRPQYGQDQEVADSIKAKIYRTMGSWHKAHEAVEKYKDTENPYTIYEQSTAELAIANEYLAKSQYAKAVQVLESLIDRLRFYGSKHELPEPHAKVLSQAETQLAKLRDMLHQSED